jgi:hypothetical protein
MFLFGFLLILYLIFEISKPKPISWTETLSKEDKDPYGAYVLFHQLKDLFPAAVINSYRQPVYNQLNNFSDSSTAYFLIDPFVNLSDQDISELLNYARSGNYVFLAAEDISDKLADTLHLRRKSRYIFRNIDSVHVNFVNPHLREAGDFKFDRFNIDDYFDKIDTASTIVLGYNQVNDANFVRISYGSGAFFVHAVPICFSNYFILTRNNARYAATALSYLPENLKQVFWDEYYKLGPEGSQNPLRFILNNKFLGWAYRIALITLILFVLFEMKRRQRIIPVIEPLRNATLDFVKTVGSVYFNQHNNKNIADKKIQYFFDFIRSRFYLSTASVDEDFMRSLSKKSGMNESAISELLNIVVLTAASEKVSDKELMALNNQIDSFYQKAK